MHGRYEYSGIAKRPDFTWPEGKRLAVYVAVNLEWFNFNEGLGAQLATSTQPDVLNYAWRDWGNRVGAWRLLDLLKLLDLPCSLLCNSDVAAHAPDLVKAYLKAGAELVGHGLTNSERQADMSPEQEASIIQKTAQTLAECNGGESPKGWLGPWISESLLTPDLLQEAGFTYVLDWCHDDQPVWMRTRGGRILSVPYSQELNDIPAIVSNKHSGKEFAEMLIDGFDEMHHQAKSQTLVLGIALHPYIVGQPHRIGHLRRALQHMKEHAGDDTPVVFTTAGQIAKWTSGLMLPVPGSNA